MAVNGCGGPEKDWTLAGVLSGRTAPSSRRGWRDIRSSETAQHRRQERCEEAKRCFYLSRGRFLVNVRPSAKNCSLFSKHQRTGRRRLPTQARRGGMLHITCVLHGGWSGTKGGTGSSAWGSADRARNTYARRFQEAIRYGSTAIQPVKLLARPPWLSICADDARRLAERYRSCLLGLGRHPERAAKSASVNKAADKCFIGIDRLARCRIIITERFLLAAWAVTSARERLNTSKSSGYHQFQELGFVSLSGVLR